jgi:hypothetical protein
LIIYPIRGNYTICNIKSLVSNETSFSSIKFLVHLNIVDFKVVIKFIKLRQRILERGNTLGGNVLLRQFANGGVIESYVVS